MDKYRDNIHNQIINDNKNVIIDDLRKLHLDKEEQKDEDIIGDFVYFSAIYGNLDIIKYIYDELEYNKDELVFIALDFAMQYKHLHIVRYLVADLRILDDCI